MTWTGLFCADTVPHVTSFHTREGIEFHDFLLLLSLLSLFQKHLFLIRTQNTEQTETELKASKQVIYIIEMIKICVFTLFFCSLAGEDYIEVQLPDYKVQAGKHIIQTSVISQKYLVRSKPAPVNVCGDPTAGRSI